MLPPYAVEVKIFSTVKGNFFLAFCFLRWYNGFVKEVVKCHGSMNFVE